jgi:hypothetical protein
MADYRADLYSQFGVLLAQIDTFFSIDVVRVVNDVGVLVIEVPSIYDSFIFYNNGILDDVVPDNRIQLMRRVGAGTFYVYTDTQWFIRDARKVLTGDGKRITVIKALCANNLLTRRIVAYDSGSAQADKSDQADDLIKAVVRENLGSLATDPLRSISSYLTVQADSGSAPTISKAFSRRNLLDIFREVALSSYKNGTYLAYDIVVNSPTVLDFRTYIGQRGIDHRWPASNNALLFGPEHGNLTNIVRGYDHTQEVTYAYSGGQGIGTARVIGAASDTIRIAQSPFGRIEKFTDSRMTIDPTILADEADFLVKSGIPINSFIATIVDTPATTYGLHYNFGDYITAVFEGESIDARIDMVRVTFRDGKEVINAQIKGNIT